MSDVRTIVRRTLAPFCLAFAQSVHFGTKQGFELGSELMVDSDFVEFKVEIKSGVVGHPKV